MYSVVVQHVYNDLDILRYWKNGEQYHFTLTNKFANKYYVKKLVKETKEYGSSTLAYKYRLRSREIRFTKVVQV